MHTALLPVHILIFTHSHTSFNRFLLSLQLLGSLPGVDPNDPDIQNALKNLKKDDDKDGKKDGGDK